MIGIIFQRVSNLRSLMPLFLQEKPSKRTILPSEGIFRSIFSLIWAKATSTEFSILNSIMYVDFFFCLRNCI